MAKLLPMILAAICLFAGCSKVPLSEDIENDIAVIDKEIDDTIFAMRNYSADILVKLANVRLETLKSTKNMLEQKNTGIKRYIPVSYSVDGEKYNSPKDKTEILKKIDTDLCELRDDLMNSELESDRYIGGLLKILALTKVVTLKNSIAFLEQKKLLLKYDIPFYAILHRAENVNGQEFKATPGKDIDKF